MHVPPHREASPAAPVFVTEEEYLRTTYRPDRELIDGELREKAMPIVAEPVFVTEEEYLRTSYRPDRELIDGELREKAMPTGFHSFVQAMIALWFGTHMKEWGVAPASEFRTRVRPGNFRLPDVSVVRFPTQLTKTQEEPPLLTIEILSDDDKVSDLRKRAGDLDAMDVRHIWLIDPEERSAAVWTDGTYWKPEARPHVPGTPVHLDLDWLWTQVDIVTGKADFSVGARED